LSLDYLTVTASKSKRSHNKSIQTSVHESINQSKMPYTTVKETVTQTRRIRICERCRHQLSFDDSNNLPRAGSLIGSLGACMGAGALVGAVLGPVGMIGGAIAGSFAGAQAGAKAGTKANEIMEEKYHSQPYCSECQAILAKEDQARGGNIGDNNPTQFLKRVSGNIWGAVEQHFGYPPADPKGEPLSPKFWAAQAQQKRGFSRLGGAVAGAVLAPVLLSVAGFTAGGVAAGSLAAGIQSAVYGGATTGAFSLLQAAGTGAVGSMMAVMGGASYVGSVAAGRMAADAEDDKRTLK